MGEHVDRSEGLDRIFPVEHFEVACLCGRVATDVNDGAGMGVEDGTDDVSVHAGTGRVGDDDVGTSVAVNKFGVEEVFHVSGQKFDVFDMVERGIDLGVFDGFGYVFNADDFAGLAGYEVGNGARSGVPVEDEFVSAQLAILSHLFV